MTRYTIRGGIPPARHTGRRRPDQVPDLQPAAGHYLLTGIEAVLAGLTATVGAPPDGGRLADELRSALARTAACGDTCRVRAAADAVRSAAGLLLTGPTDAAVDALRQARAKLIARPVSPVRADNREGVGRQGDGVTVNVRLGQREQDLLDLPAQRNGGVLRA